MEQQSLATLFYWPFASSVNPIHRGEGAMPESIADLVLNQLAAVLREAIEGSPERWSYFTDSGQKGGFIGTLTPLTAEGRVARGRRDVYRGPCPPRRVGDG